MKITGTFWKSTESQLWLAEIPALDLMTQAMSEAEIPEMIKDAIALLSDCEQSVIDVSIEGSTVTIDAPDGILTKLIQERQHVTCNSMLNQITIEDENLCLVKR